QIQIRLNQLDQQLGARVGDGGAGGDAPGGGERAPGTGGAPGGGTGGGQADDFSMAEQFYEIGLEQLQRGNAGTARRAFQNVVDSFPSHPLAPQAQFQLGETYVLERGYDEALQAFDAVVSCYPNADAAPRALYRAGVV